MKIMLAQINPRVGDLEGNFQQAVSIMNSANTKTVDASADLVVFPELSVMGYPPKDLLEKPAFVAAVLKYNEKWAALSAGGAAMVFGSVYKRVSKEGKPLNNVAFLADRGEVIGYQPKTLLPTYDVFDEARYFQPGPYNLPLKLGKWRLGISICEDIWNDKEFWKEHLYPVDPIQNLVDEGCDILINISASPFAVGKPEIREKMLSHIAKRHALPLIYVNQNGGNDDVVYDGRSLVFDELGVKQMELTAFGTCSHIMDTGAYIGRYKDCMPQPKCEAEEIFNALVLGTRDYARKTGFQKAVIGLSGGIDSALVAVVAADALGPENVLGVAMPSKYSSQHSVDDAFDIAQKLDITCLRVPIEKAHASYMEMMLPRFGPPNPNVDPWEENVQARCRAIILMAISNRENRLLLTTGNKSEVAVGYCTLYGDTCGGLAVISDVFKTKVYDIAKWINRGRSRMIIPEGSINKPPSAELRPGQTDQQSLPPYPVLDEILRLYVEEHLEIEEIINRGVSPESKSIVEAAYRLIVGNVCRMVDNNEYKRRQLAPGLRVTRKAFGTGRQMPIAQGWRK